ncbi:MAG: hypothetical protein MUE88_10920, partial [Flavobacteriales bacterium]|nr:hypothetical protein [Flavobacteriales bacterium]
HWLVLLARLLALACLVLAFARPYFQSSSSVSGEQTISLYVDDSHSMDAQGSEGRALDAARGAARSIITQGTPSTRYQVLTGRFQGREQLLVDRDEALESASRVGTGPSTRPLSQVMARSPTCSAASPMWPPGPATAPWSISWSLCPRSPR